MATLTLTYTFTGGTNATASEVNTNLTDVKNFINTTLLHADGAIAATGQLTLGAGDPSAAAHAARKAYVDATATAAAASIAPIGSFLPWLGTAAPTNHVLAYGQTLVGANITYPTLFTNCDAVFKSGNDIIVPDLRGRVPVGLDNMGGSDAGRVIIASMGTTGGYNTPQTTSTASGGVSANHTHAFTGPLGPSTGVESVGHTHTYNAPSTTADRNLQPSILLNWILRVA